MESYHVAGPSVIVAPGTQGHVPSPPARAIVRARHRDGTPLVTEWPRLLCAALVAVGPAAVARAQAPESCAALAQFGAYDTRPGLKDAERGEAFRNWVCQANIALESDLRQAGSAVGIAPEVLEATLGYDPNGAQDFLDWKHAFCAAARPTSVSPTRFPDLSKASHRPSRPRLPPATSRPACTRGSNRPRSSATSLSGSAGPRCRTSPPPPTCR